MIGILAALFSLSPPVPVQLAAGDPVIFATIGHSEWCPAGNVQINLRTGDYAITPRAPRAVCGDPKLVRPVQHGTLSAAELPALREAFERAIAQGLDGCRVGERGWVISNGGTPVFVLTYGAGTRAAPDDLGCWSAAANALYESIDRRFQSAHQR
jgi:hypothetical protein